VGESGAARTTPQGAVQLLRGQSQMRAGAVDGKTCSAWPATRCALRVAAFKSSPGPFASLILACACSTCSKRLAELRPISDTAARRASLEALVDQVGLCRDALERYPHEFSGGQRQRIAIAGALAFTETDRCDEPTSRRRVGAGADPEPAEALPAELGVFLPLITHNIGVVEYIATRWP